MKKLVLISSFCNNSEKIEIPENCFNNYQGGGWKINE